MAEELSRQKKITPERKFADKVAERVNRNVVEECAKCGITAVVEPPKETFYEFIAEILAEYRVSVGEPEIDPKRLPVSPDQIPIYKLGWTDCLRAMKSAVGEGVEEQKVMTEKLPTQTPEEFWPIWLKQKFPEYKDQAAAFMEEWGWRKVAWEAMRAYADHVLAAYREKFGVRDEVGEELEDTCRKWLSDNGYFDDTTVIQDCINTGKGFRAGWHARSTLGSGGVEGYVGTCFVDHSGSVDAGDPHVKTVTCDNWRPLPPAPGNEGERK
jgi:hypothetical protein